MKPLYDAIAKYTKKRKARFHMPSHGGKVLVPLFGSAPFDVTELPFSDNLNEPTGVIAEAEKLLAEAYGTEDALMFTTGATSAVLVALAAARGARGESIIVERNAHTSAFSALRTIGFVPHLVTNNKDQAAPLTAETVSLALEKTKARTVFLTSPDYYGRCADLAAIRKVCDEKNALLIVDAAHGSHFAFSSLLPDSATKYAHLAVLSLHKTMPVMTGGAVLAVACDLSAETRVFRACLTTTSPSYVTMCSIDYARELFSFRGETLYAELKTEVDEFKKSLPQFRFLDNDDWSRIVFDADFRKLEKAGFYPEIGDGDGVVLIANPVNGGGLAALARALQNARPVTKSTVANAYDCPVLTEGLVLPPLSARFETVPLSAALGRTAFSSVGLYPPGVPLIAAGEKFSAASIGVLENHKDSSFGFVNGKVCVIIE